VHTDAGGLRGRAQLFGELVVREVVAEAQPECVELGLRELRERLVEAVEPDLLGLDGCGLTVEALENAEPGAGGTLESASADRCRQDVARDPEEPRSGGPTRDVFEAGACEPRLRERLRGQVVRRVCVSAAAQIEAVHPLGVPAVELPERPGVGSSRLDEVRVAPHPQESVVIATSTVVVAMRWREGLTMLRLPGSSGSTRGETGVTR